ncbi:hypothetical protein QTO30_00725 [Yoonia sp. GPGPB17]|uniref:hypothetical protein n=1 Tax=Yoonia sp. GPGPB17 TaxID=3026147 RepID=UPI0030C5FAF3
MYTFWFSAIWTTLTSIGVIYLWQEPEFVLQTPLFKIVMTAMPFVGVPFVWDSLRKLRLLRSVREVKISGHTEFVWTELDGSEKSSETDPRPAWDNEDRNFAD